jgi:hypothetical protein
MTKIQFRQMSKTTLVLLMFLGITFIFAETSYGQYTRNNKGRIVRKEQMVDADELFEENIKIAERLKKSGKNAIDNAKKTTGRSNVALSFSLHILPKSVYGTRRMRVGQPNVSVSAVADGGKKISESNPYQYRWKVQFIGNDGQVTSTYGGQKFTSKSSIPLIPRRPGTIKIDVTVRDGAGTEQTGGTAITVVN